jgi:hypothetical protein
MNGCYSFGCREQLLNEYEEPCRKPLHFDGNCFLAIVSLVFLLSYVVDPV